MYYTAYETPIFVKSIQTIWTNSERMEFIEWISCNPNAGNVIPGTEGMRKVRWRKQSFGKRSSARVIYLNQLPKGEIYLLIVYTKSKFDNLSNDFLIRLKNEVLK